MQKSLRVVVAAALIGLCVGAWFILFPSPEKVIRSRLNNLAKTVSFEPKDGAIARAYNAQKAADFFTVDVEANLDIKGYEPIILNGRDEILQRALVASRVLQGLNVEFLDINITLGPDKQTATANLTGKATISGDREFNAQEFNFQLKKVDGKWLIYRVETVKTLSQRNFSHAA
jgi:hypothetical protein